MLGPAMTHFSEKSRCKGFSRKFHSPGVIRLGTRSTGCSLALSQASPKARLIRYSVCHRELGTHSCTAGPAVGEWGWVTYSTTVPLPQLPQADRLQPRATPDPTCRLRIGW